MRNLPPEHAWEQWLTLSLKSKYYPIFVGHTRVQVNLYQDDCFVNLYSSILVNLFQDKTYWAGCYTGCCKYNPKHPYTKGCKSFFTCTAKFSSRCHLHLFNCQSFHRYKILVLINSYEVFRFRQTSYCRFQESGALSVKK